MIETPTYPAISVQDGRAIAPKASASMVAALSLMVVAVLWFAGNGPLLRLAIPAIAAFLGLVLYLNHPILYVQYALWVWFLTPLLRRVVDWRFGWSDPNIVLLSPLLVSGVAGLAFLRKDGKAWREIPVVFVLCGAAILYGFVVGMLQRPSAETAYGLLNWLCPLLFGLHLYLNWPEYEQHRAAISNSFLWALLILGVYGIFQFLAPPAWDRYWLENVTLDINGSTFGQPESLLVRVWSTANAPGPFANIMMVGLLLLLVTRSPLKLPAAVAGYISFLLSMVRTAWLSWIVGLFWILKSAKPRVMVRVVLSILILLAFLLPAVSDPRLALVIKDRLTTFADLEHDASLGARLEMYRQLLGHVASDPFGHGLSNEQIVHGYAVDSGILAAALSLGWLGMILLSLGMVSIFVRGEQYLTYGDDFVRAAKAILIVFLVQLVGGNIFVSVTGAMFWTFTGMYLAARKYHEDLGSPLVLQYP
jgi:hypothetical protein